MTALINNFIQLYCYVIILRIWFQLVNIDYYNQGSQLLLKVTEPLITPLRTLLPIRFKSKVDIYACILLVLIQLIRYVWLLNMNSQGTSTSFFDISYYAIIMTGFSIIKQAITLLFWIVIIRALLSWFNQRSLLDYILAMLTEPILSKIRRVLPNTGMIDFSVTVLILLIICLSHALPYILSSKMFVLWNLA